MKMNAVLPLRIVQVVLSLVVMVLSGYVANWYHSDLMAAAPDQVNFLIFSSLWSIISVGCLEIVPRFFPKASHPYGALAFEFTNVVFFFAGFIALAVFLSRLSFCNGTVCSAAQADTAFAAFLFVNWGVTIVFAVRDLFKSGFRRAAAAPKMNGGVPMKETLA